MVKTQTKPKSSAAERAEVAAAPWGPVLTQAAFVITIALVIARALMSEVLRDAIEAVPGGDVIPRGTGPTSSLVLDLLCWTPALLVLVRKVIENDYVIRLRLSHVLFGLFAIAAALSTIWAADKFAALVTAAHMLTAAVLIWSTTQLVRSWLRLRLVAGICFGLLLAYLAHGLIYRFVDSADTAKFYEEHKVEILRQRGWDPDSYSAKAFEKKLLAREMIGFNQSPNSFAAVIVMLLIASAAMAIQRTVDQGDRVTSLSAVATSLPIAALVLYCTGSRTALGTILIAAAILGAVAILRKWLARHSALAFWIGIAMAVLVVVAVVGYGVWHKTLPSDSLAFRWRYWIASNHLFVQHPWVGVGWSNFGPYYLAVRLPIAAEEIRDPHNYLVRAFVELGTIGGILLLAWLGRTAWELTRPIAPPASAKSSSQSRRAYRSLSIAIVGGVGINALASLDFSQSGSYLLLEIFRRLVYLGLIFIGTLLITVRSMKDQEAEDGAAPWVLYGMLAALAVFIVHNLVDFSLAEPGPLMIFALLLGTVMGVRTNWSSSRWQSRRIAAAALCALGLLWVAAFLGFALPVADAEQQAQAADDAIRANRPAEASSLLRSAYERMPINADYAFRAARAMIWAKEENAGKIRYMLETAIARDPMEVSYYLTRGIFEMHQKPIDADAVKRDFGKALDLDPNNVAARLDYAKALEQLGNFLSAMAENRIALQRDNQLSPDEPRRLPEKKVDEIERKIKELATKLSAKP